MRHVSENKVHSQTLQPVQEMELLVSIYYIQLKGICGPEKIPFKISLECTEGFNVL